MPDPSRIAATVVGVRRIGGDDPVQLSSLIEGGLTRAQVRAAAARNELFQIQRGIWLARESWEEVKDTEDQLRLAARAALMAFPGCVVSHATAAQLHGLPVPPSEEWSRRTWLTTPDMAIGDWPIVHLTRIKGRSIASRSYAPWVQVHGGHGKVTSHQVEGVPITDVMTTAVDVSCSTSTRWALAIMDAAIRRTFGPSIEFDFIRREIRGRISRHVRRPGIRRVRRVTPLVNPAAESALESISRWHMHRARIPAPELNVDVLGSDGKNYRADFYWKAQRVIGEADGMGKYMTIEDLHAEKRRHLALEQAGWRVVRWDWQQALWQPRQVVSLVRAALEMPSRR